MMIDSDMPTLRAFCIALYEQKPDQVLPANVLVALRSIAQDLDNRVAELDQLAEDTTMLAGPYEQAYLQLTSQAAERSKGKDFPADPVDHQPDQEQTNVARDVQSDILEFQQFLANISSETASEILSAPNPIQAIQARGRSEQR